MADIKKRLIILASGHKNCSFAASDVQILADYTQTNPVVLNATIAAVITDCHNSHLYDTTYDYKVPLVVRENHYNKEFYQKMMSDFEAKFAVFFDWPHPCEGLEIGKMISVHCGPLNISGGHYGFAANRLIMEAFARGEIKNSLVKMCFGGWFDGYTTTFFQHPVAMHTYDSDISFMDRAREILQAHLPGALEKVVSGLIYYHNGRVLSHDHGPKLLYGIK
jgi:hypothetical protein